MERICFQLRVDPDRVDEYRERHASVRPVMLRAIERSGRHNYSLFLASDGLLVGYYETESVEESQRLLAADAAAAEWEREMAPFFVSIDGRADQAAARLAEVFNLETQLSALPKEQP